MGQPRFPRRNLHNIVLLVDPSSADGIRNVISAFQMLQQNAPVRFGFVFVSKDEVKQYIRHESARSSGGSILLDVNGNVFEHSTPSQEHALGLFNPNSFASKLNHALHLLKRSSTDLFVDFLFNVSKQPPSIKKL